MATNYTTYDDDHSLGKDAPKISSIEFVTPEKVDITPGKVHVILFWAKWDKGGYAVLDAVSALSKQFPDVDFVAISNDPAKTDVTRFLEKKEATLSFPVAFDAGKAVHNEYRDVAGLGAMGIPHLFIVNKEGKIVWREQFAQAHPLAKGQFAEQLRRVVAGEELVKNGEKPKVEVKKTEEEDAPEEDFGSLF